MPSASRRLLHQRLSFLLSMASLLSVSLVFAFIFLSSLSPSHSRQPHLVLGPRSDPIRPEILLACNATRFRDPCLRALSWAHLPEPPGPLDLILAALGASAKDLKTAQSTAQSILASSGRDRNRSNAAANCVEFLRHSAHRLSLTSSPDALPRGRTKDARAWASAALLYQYDCFSALKYVNSSQQVNDAMAFILSLTDLTSNALSMIRSFDLFGPDLSRWRPPATERDGFWEDAAGGSGGPSRLRGAFPPAEKADATVCQGGGGCYSTVQAAVDAAPEGLGGGRGFVIYIREGVYRETVRVPLEKTNVVFLGDGMGRTVITGDLSADAVGVSTYNTATVGVSGDGFMARGLTFENAAGPDAHQAVAFRSDSDQSVVEGCEFRGHQDTLYARSLRQFYRSCRISGTVDFIFGNSATVIADSEVVVVPRQLRPEKGEKNAVTAQGRTDPAQSTGFVLQNCAINGSDDYVSYYRKNPKVHRNYLGRPWKEFSRTVFVRCLLGEIIAPEGWLPWSGNFALSTLYYGEFESTGPGGGTGRRVGWSSQIPAEHVPSYSVESFIQGDGWIPSLLGKRRL